MGFGGALNDVVGDIPTNWQVTPFNHTPPSKFLATIDFFVYYHHPDWVEAYGRSIIEAMAAGCVPVLHPRFRDLFGDGAIYALPANVLQTVQHLHQSPNRFIAQSTRSTAVAEEIAGPKILLERVANLIGGPKRRRETQTARLIKKPKIMFFTSNGVGMGHLTRSLAVARRLPDTVEPVFLTLSKAFDLVRQEGIHAEYLPFHKSTCTEINVWNSHLRREVQAAIAFHRPDVFVFDGNVPYFGMLDALENFPALWRVWMRRGMWAPGSGQIEISRQGKFHAVIEPADIAGNWDRGLTQSNRDKTYPVAPIRYLRDSEILGRAAARRELGLAAKGVAVLLQLGSGNNFDLTRIRNHILDRLLAEPDLQVVCADWLIGDQISDLPEKVIRIQKFPLSKLFKAFDFSVGAVGYNSFHEVIHAELPTLFIPNQNPQQDEQHLRAKYATLKGMAKYALSGDPYRADAALDDLLNPDMRTEMRAACAKETRANGANEAARYLSEMALTRRQILA